MQDPEEVTNFSNRDMRVIVLALYSYTVKIAGFFILPVHINLMLTTRLALQLHVVLNGRRLENIIVHKLLVDPLGKALK